MTTVGITAKAKYRLGFIPVAFEPPVVHSFNCYEQVSFFFQLPRIHVLESTWVCYSIFT